MSTTTNAAETNGTGTNGDGAPKNRVRAALSAGTKFQRLYALAARAERKTFTAKRETEEGSVALKMDGFPQTLDAAGVAKLAQNGAKLAGTVVVGAATGRFSGVLLGQTAAEMVAEMTAE
jgi:hypothetical protein